MKNLFIASAVASTIALIGGANANAATLLVDSFSDGDATLTAPQGAGTTTTVFDYDTGLSSTIGGDRRSTLTVTGCSPSVDGCGDAQINITPPVGGTGAAEVAFAPAINGTGTFSLEYTGFNIADIRPFQLKIDGLSFDATAVAGSELTVDIVANGTEVNLTGNISADLDASGNGTITFDGFKFLTEAEGTNVTLLRINAITEQASDFIFTDIRLETVPEPSNTIPLLGLGLVASGAWLKRKVSA